ncbi:MAG: exosome complex protein Rrp42 [Thermoplasmata archaeon]|uniref:Exosome complex component Rrp42 n=1 Tax=Candidatus Sysuiplasma superficiale TaxID=2823368 RepID=A0A8J7YI84_9ARCH|nr:exosome complex protein Rrp42 [Candidatus Sysuiplasma superficiale]MBX8644796.1 exosome complex protein Rrp42 [Candidatus Sysuiplasma superficiale]MCL4347452.1 exosome complex protein Rrp42 [Candidatus Thermoplasmatota archaeon]
MSDVKRGHILNVLSRGVRTDGRKFDEFREITVETGIVESAEGSARLRLGNTEVIVGIKMEVGEPFADSPDKGVLTTNVELIPMASDDFESGPPSPSAIELSRVVDRGIRESQLIDMSALCITPKEEVWVLYIDVYPLDYDGNLFDAASLAAISALKHTVVPAKRYGKGENYQLPLRSVPVSCTTVKIGDRLIVDPTLEEEDVSSARLTVATDENGDIRAMQKGGTGYFTLDEVRTAIKMSVAAGSTIRNKL